MDQDNTATPDWAALMEGTRELVSISRTLSPELPDAFRKGQVYSALMLFVGATDRFDEYDIVSEVCAQECIN